MITVKGLTKRYAHNTAVDHISFEVQKGQIVGFLGPNGAGKTTTMRILTCFLPPSEGSATVAGFDVLEQPMEVKKRIGYLPETPPLYPEMEVREYLTFVGKLKGLRGGDVRKRVDYVIERCNVADEVGAGIVAVEEVEKLDKGNHRPTLMEVKRPANSQVSLNVWSPAELIETGGYAVYGNTTAAVRGSNDERPGALDLSQGSKFETAGNVQGASQHETMRHVLARLRLAGHAAEPAQIIHRRGKICNRNAQ